MEGISDQVYVYRLMPQMRVLTQCFPLALPQGVVETDQPYEKALSVQHTVGACVVQVFWEIMK